MESERKGKTNDYESLKSYINTLAIEWRKSGEKSQRDEIIQKAFELYGRHFKYRKNLKDYSDDTKENGFLGALEYTIRKFDPNKGSFIACLEYMFPRCTASEYRKERIEKDKKFYGQEQENYKKEQEQYEKEGGDPKEIKKPSQYMTFLSFNQKVNKEEDAKELLDFLEDKNQLSIEDTYEKRESSKDKIQIGIIEQTARIINFTEKNFGRKTANPSRRRWYRIFYTEYITYITKKMQEFGVDLSDRLHERDIFHAMRTNVAECGMNENAKTYLDYYMSDICETLRAIGRTKMKLYRELENFKEDFDPTKADIRIAIPLTGNKAGEMPQDIAIGYLKNYGIEGNKSRESDVRKLYKEYIEITCQELDELEKKKLEKC